jgi:spore coat polysaccharide biosynthesis protein SpsF
MRVICTIQARHSSRRLPGKILLNLGNRPSLEHLIESTTHAAGLDGVLIATSIDETDDATADFAAARAIPCHRGSLTDVARRLLDAGAAQNADAIVRISGDSPLLDPALIEQAVAMFRDVKADVVTNVWPRTFPKGQSVEVIALSALRAAVARMTTAEEREHVTRYFYEHPQDFSIVSFTTDDGRPDVQLSIDNHEDYARCVEIFRVLPGPPWQVGWRGCVAAYDRCVAAKNVGMR